MQVVHGDSYRQEAESQYTSSGDVFDRGSIYFTEKDGTPFGAAILQTGYILAINPEHIQNPEVVYDQLSKIIPIDKTAFLKSAEKQNDPYEKITDHIKDTDAEKISKLKIPGVGLYPEKWRFYPGGDTASHILGFVGYQGNTLAGRYGLEQEYNNVLSESGPGIDMNLFAEVFAGNSGTSSPQEGTRKGDVYTTIEPTVENFLENTLKQAKEKWNAETVGGIIMNPKTGEIYAMAAFPQFNPNDYASADISTFKDPLVGSVFEMGSVFKALTMAAALDVGAVTPNTMYDDKGSIIINGARVSNWDFKARGWISMQT
ncbi:MAG TPA: penicillin-binding transpeptidase domain-containing protein, partial [Candidatus Paceibacterota bacterium]|nr:penicillin-binding transpeptidase domain-containing protein [Candidatus Paceibacterota bacterium]